MAKRETVTLTEKDVEIVEAAALAPAAPKALARPASFRGLEELNNAADFAIPRIALAQRTSKQIQPGEKRIKDLEMFQMFNSVTDEVYGSGPIPFAVVRFTKKGIEFNDKNEVVDYNVPVTMKPDGTYVDDRLNFTFASDGRTRLKPRATLFYEYLVLVPGKDGLIVPAMISMKGTQLKVGRRFNTVLRMTGADAWTRMYALSSTQEPTNFGPVGQFVIRPNGITSADVNEAAESLFVGTQGKTVVAADYENDPAGDADAIPF